MTRTGRMSTPTDRCCVFQMLHSAPFFFFFCELLVVFGPTPICFCKLGWIEDSSHFHDALLPLSAL